MTKKILFTLFACLLIQQDTHPAGLFNKAARGLYQTTKWGLIAAPAIVAGIGFSGYKYLEKYYPENLESIIGVNIETHHTLDKNSMENLIGISSPNEAENLKKVLNFVKEKASKQLGTSPENIIVKADSKNSTSYTALQKNGTTYHIINLQLDYDGITDLKSDLTQLIQYNKPGYGAFAISHEIGHGALQHGKYLKFFPLGSLMASYLAGCLLLKKGNALSIAKNSSTFSILAKTVAAATLASSSQVATAHIKYAIQRSNEWEADNYAIQDLKNPDIFEKAAQIFDKHHAKMQFFGIKDSTHPSSHDRAEHLRKAAAKLRNTTK